MARIGVRVGPLWLSSGGRRRRHSGGAGGWIFVVVLLAALVWLWWEPVVIVVGTGLLVWGAVEVIGRRGQSNANVAYLLAHPELLPQPEVPTTPPPVPHDVLHDIHGGRPCDTCGV